MVNRSFGVLYILAGLWAAFILILFGGFDTVSTNAGFALVGLPPIFLVGIIHYIIFGRL